ncbi:MAG TPA: diacylglycerol kinase [Rhodobacteraceae bacterium]|nr:diacylglycerol kinase [Paracoccaceae bacterium]
MNHGSKHCVILNEGAGDQACLSARLDMLESTMSQHGLRADFRVLSGNKNVDPGTVAQEAVQDGYTELVAAGGDGTVAAVAGVAWRSGTSLGVLPMGTFNFFARSLGIPEEMGEAMTVLARGQTRQVELGLMNDLVFLNNASIGLYPAILEQREGIYDRWGRSRLAAYGSVPGVLLGRHRIMRLDIQSDGESHRRRTALAFVCNSAFQLRQYGIEAEDEIAAGKFALLTSRRGDRRDLLRAAWRLARGKPRKTEDFDLIFGREIVIDLGCDRCTTALDGEKREAEPTLRFTKAPGGLAVIVPEAGSDAA